MEIIKSVLTDKVSAAIVSGFHEYSVEKIGVDEYYPKEYFEARIDGKAVGQLVVRRFGGQLHIKVLLVNKESRSSGIGTKLMQNAFKFGRENGCTFAFVETMSFQAPLFYQKFGFKVDFVREGYAGNTSLYYLSRDLW